MSIKFPQCRMASIPGCQFYLELDGWRRELLWTMVPVEAGKGVSMATCAYMAKSMKGSLKLNIIVRTIVLIRFFGSFLSAHVAGSLCKNPDWQL